MLRFSASCIPSAIPCSGRGVSENEWAALSRLHGSRRVQEARQLSRRECGKGRFNVIRCSTTAARGRNLPHDKVDHSDVLVASDQSVLLELSIHKSSDYTWPPQHKLLLSLVSASQVHPDNGQGIETRPVEVFIPSGQENVKIHVDVPIPRGFGTPAALRLHNPHSEEFFLESLSWRLSGDASITSHPRHFWCNSWVTETRALTPRIFFTNEVFLPNQTPLGLVKLRHTELTLLRGDGIGRRIAGERIYDYDVYNDLGNPDMDEASSRPVLGASQDLPYPRRCRTGRERTATDPNSEAPELDSTPFYVPRDEQFSSTKQQIFGEKLQLSRMAVAFNILPDLDAAMARKDQHIPTFSSLEEIRRLYEDGTFPLPSIIQADQDAWWTDEEFARQRLAGLNPLMIERVKEFPLKSLLDPDIYGPATSAITAQHIQHNLEGLTVGEAITHKRLFVLDYHDVLVPVLRQINAKDEDKVYASRTLFFLTNEGSLNPIAIELSFPAEEHLHRAAHETIKTVLTPPPRPIEEFPGNDEATWLWQLAKAQVAINDTGYHQLISHWLRTHACIEPFVIASHRQLSVLHPLHRLLFPHFKDTMSINGLARKYLISSDGVIESTFFPRSLCMQFSSLVYKNWRFDEQGLPEDLIKRGMAERNASNELILTIKDYPYAVDGLVLWTALQTWVREYLDIYYENDQAVQGDEELQKWWKEIKETGHGDHSQAEWWGKMETKEELEKALVTIMWVSSGHHAAVNFGQYAYAGFMPNNPTVGRRRIPDNSNAEELIELKENPERFHLSSLGTRVEAVSVMGTLLLLSQHIEEEFLGQNTAPHWTCNSRVLSAFRRFARNLKQLEADINDLNQDPSMRNRHGPAQMPYKLLFPSSPQGLTNQGVPNSISI